MRQFGRCGRGHALGRTLEDVHATRVVESSYSAREVLKARDFAEFTEDDMRRQSSRDALHARSRATLRRAAHVEARSRHKYRTGAAALASGRQLRIFNIRWAGRTLSHGAIVLFVSDSWDRGDPTVLAREMARLQRCCRRLIWLNPLLGVPGHQPLTRGMQAALPYVDDFSQSTT